MTQPSEASRPFFEVALRQRACRHFDPDAPVADADLAAMLRAATHAPSAENCQPWVFVVVRDATRRQAISAMASELWSMGAKAYAEPHLTPDILDDVERSIDAGFGAAPVLVVVGADTTRVPHELTVQSSIFPCVQNLLLAANALGYGSALTTLTTLFADRLRAVVDLPDHVSPLAVVPVGRAARPLGPPRRRPVAEVAHLNTWGTPFG